MIGGLKADRRDRHIFENFLPKQEVLRHIQTAEPKSWCPSVDPRSTSAPSGGLRITEVIIADHAVPLKMIKIDHESFYF